MALELLECATDRLRCRVDCSAGTYIRRLAETVAQRLGTVGHLSALTRLTVGPWDLSQALEVQQIMETTLEDLGRFVQPVERIDAPARHA